MSPVYKWSWEVSLGTILANKRSILGYPRRNCSSSSVLVKTSLVLLCWSILICSFFCFFFFFWWVSSSTLFLYFPLPYYFFWKRKSSMYREILKLTKYWTKYIVELPIQFYLQVLNNTLSWYCGRLSWGCSSKYLRKSFLSSYSPPKQDCS